MTVLNRAMLFAKAGAAIVQASGDAGAAADRCFQLGRDDVGQVCNAVRKNSVGPFTTASGLTFSVGSKEFVDFAWPLTILGQLDGVQELPFESAVGVISQGGSASWVGEGFAQPAGKMAVTAQPLAQTKLGTLVVLSGDVVKLVGQQLEAQVQSSLTHAVVAGIDEAFFSTSAGSAGVQPPGILHGITPISATGDPSVDLAALIESFQGDLQHAYFVTDAVTATRLALHRDSHGAYVFPDVGPRGGQLLTIPLIASRSSPVTSSGAGIVALIDASGIQVSDGGISLLASTEASIAMVDNPSGAMVQVSMFQTNSVALRTIHLINWQRLRSTAVAYLDNVSW